MTRASRGGPGAPNLSRLGPALPFDAALFGIDPSSAEHHRDDEGRYAGGCALRGGHGAHGTAQHLAAGAKWHLVDPG
jgi:hypothetical protein